MRQWEIDSVKMMENEMRPFRLSDCDVENTSHEQIAANKRAATLSSWTVGDGIHQIHGSASFNTPTSSTTTQHYDEEEMRGSPFSLCGWPLRKRHFQGVCSQFNFGASQSGGEKQKCGGRERKERLELHDDDNVRKNKNEFRSPFLGCFIFSLWFDCDGTHGTSVENALSTLSGGWNHKQST